MAKKPTFPCPVCGKDVPVKSKACPSCGACDKSGWNEDESLYDGLDLPEDDFNYEEFTQQEFGTPRRTRGRQLLWKITAAVLLGLTIILILANRLFH